MESLVLKSVFVGPAGPDLVENNDGSASLGYSSLNKHKITGFGLKINDNKNYNNSNIVIDK